MTLYILRKEPLADRILKLAESLNDFHDLYPPCMIDAEIRVDFQNKFLAAAELFSQVVDEFNFSDKPDEEIEHMLREAHLKYIEAVRVVAPNIASAWDRIH